MDSFLIGILKPFLVLALFAGLVIPMVLLLHKIIPEGKVKRFLYKRR